MYLTHNLEVVLIGLGDGGEGREREREAARPVLRLLARAAV